MTTPIRDSYGEKFSTLAAEMYGKNDNFTKAMKAEIKNPKASIAYGKEGWKVDTKQEFKTHFYDRLVHHLKMVFSPKYREAFNKAVTHLAGALNQYNASIFKSDQLRAAFINKMEPTRAQLAEQIQDIKAQLKKLSIEIPQKEKELEAAGNALDTYCETKGLRKIKVANMLIEDFKSKRERGIVPDEFRMLTPEDKAIAFDQKIRNLEKNITLLENDPEYMKLQKVVNDLQQQIPKMKDEVGKHQGFLRNYQEGATLVRGEIGKFSNAEIFKSKLKPEAPELVQIKKSFEETFSRVFSKIAPDKLVDLETRGLSSKLFKDDQKIYKAAIDKLNSITRPITLSKDDDENFAFMEMLFDPDTSVEEFRYWLETPITTPMMTEITYRIRRPE